MAALSPLAPSIWRHQSVFNAECRHRGISTEVSASLRFTNSSIKSEGMRKVVEHVVLLHMNEDFSEEQEKDMLDNIYTLQYHFRGIVAVSLGRLISENQEHSTHGVYMRFASKELLFAYNKHPAHLKIAREFISPFLKGAIVADFECEVEDDLEPVFRRGEAFETGIEHIILLKVKKSATAEDVGLMLQSVNTLAKKLPSLLVQLTAGEIFSSDQISKGYTHCIVARLPSEEALEAFNKHEDYGNIFSEKILPVCDQVLSTDYRVEAVGTTVTP